MFDPNVSDPFPDPELPDFDAERRPVPPWVKYPNLRRGSMGWRMGMGERHLQEIFGPWWKHLPEAARERYRADYPAPDEWRGFLDNKPNR
jgi:hypothetical protein